ncbi:MAG: TIGR03086 family metal-binding protein [Nocardioidaceae bacterium]
MTQTIDLGPATERVFALLRGISDDQLTDPTPCPAYTLGDLVEHVGGLALAFTWAATKDFPEEAGQAPSGDASRLPDAWRDEFAVRLSGLAEAWRDPAAWGGMTQAGGVDLPGQVAGLVALNEVVVHGWDVAVASGQAYGADAACIQGCLGFVVPMSQPGREAQREGVFGPVVPVDDDAPELDRLLGLAGRDPAWSR